ncbi:unnamed protein product, partial [Clonostachys rosea]
SLLAFSTGVLGAAKLEESLGEADSLTQSTRLIVKFSETGFAKFKRSDGTHDTSGFYNTLAESGKDITPSLNFNSQFFQGVSFDVAHTDNKSIADIQALPEVEKVWPAAVFTTPTTGAATIVDGNSRLNYSSWNAHSDTNVDLLHKAGYFGKDVVIAFVDSGIDYNHPAFGGGFGPGHRIEAGWDFVGDDYTFGGAYHPDSDPMDCAGHGTHVAGIAASGDADLPGVAPQARLRAYKVFGCGTSTYEDVIIAAFLKAYEDGADVINASLGSIQGFPESATALVINSITAHGVFVAVAAGNSGTSGPFYTSNVGNAYDAVAVGSVMAEDWVAYKFTATSSSGESREIAYISDSLLQFNLNGTLGASVSSNIRQTEACTSDIPKTADDSVLIIPTGNCTWVLQDGRIIGQAANVLYILPSGSPWDRPTRQVYRNDQAKNSGTVLYEDGDWIIKQVEAGHTVSLAFVYDQKAIGIPRQGFVDGRINYYSSWGPTLDARIKPQISAPGGLILSTYPIAKGSWSVLSGTSMASPYIAGVGALFFNAHGGRSALGVGGAKLAIDRIMSSGRPVKHNDDSNNLASVAKQGAGLIDAAGAILSGSTVSPPQLLLNDTVHFQGSHKVVLTNSNKVSVTYKVVHEAGITVHTKNAGDAWVASEPPYSTAAGEVATVSLSFNSITLAAGQSATLDVEITEPADVAAKYLPIYGGRILFGGSNGDVLSVTYQGIKGSIYASDIWEMQRGVPIMLSGYGGVVEEGHNYTWEEGSDVPQPYFNVLWSTREISVDYVSKDWKPSDWVYPPVAGKNNWIGSFRIYPRNGEDPTSFPLTFYPRTGFVYYAKPMPVFANGSYIPSGEYKILCRTLRTYGDYNKIEDWQYKTSNWFRISREKKDTSTFITTPAITSPTPISTVSSTAPTTTTSSISMSTVASSTISTTASVTTSLPQCSGTSSPVELKAVIGNSSTTYNFYMFSDFMAIDLAGTQKILSWNYVNNAHLETSVNGITIAASVSVNTNSLIYLYKPSKISGQWSYLECTSNSDSTLTCLSGVKDKLYVCDTDQGIIRHGTTVLENCRHVAFIMRTLCSPHQINTPSLPSISTLSLNPTASAGTPVATPTRTQAAATTTTPTQAGNTSTQAVATTSTALPTTSAALPECSGASKPVELKAYVAGTEKSYDFYMFSDFMAIDLSSTQKKLPWQYVDSSHLQTTVSGVTIYASVTTNNNSLIYLFKPSRISGQWSYLDCATKSDGTLNCVSGTKNKLYVCDTDQGILRHGTTVLDNCRAVTFTLRTLCRAPDSTPSISTSPITSATTPVATPTTAGSQTSSTEPSISPSQISPTSKFSSTPQDSSTTVASSTSVISSTPVASSTAQGSSSPQITQSSTYGLTTESGSATATPSGIITTSVASGVSTSGTPASSVSASQSSAQTDVHSSLLAGTTSGSVPSTAAGVSQVSTGTTKNQATSGVSSSSAVPVSQASSAASISQTSVGTQSLPSEYEVSSQVSVTQTELLTTSTVFATHTYTVTACPSSIENCSASHYSTFVTTETIAISTTVCPVIQVTLPATASNTVSQGEGSGNASQPTGSTIYSTRLVTVTSCSANVPNCSASAKTTFIQTYVVPLQTTSVSSGPRVTEGASDTSWYSQFTQSAQLIPHVDSKVVISVLTTSLYASSPSSSQTLVPQPSANSQSPGVSNGVQPSATGGNTNAQPIAGASDSGNNTSGGSSTSAASGSAMPLPTVSGNVHSRNFKPLLLLGIILLASLLSLF